MEEFENFPSSGNLRLDAQLKFSAIIDRMTAIRRRTLLIDRSRCENDAEHSWHVATMALLFFEYTKDDVEVLHTVEMLLVHDLVEIYAGDTFAYDSAKLADKAEREQAAADKLFAVLPEAQQKYLHSLWNEFEANQTREARYANCLDSIQPFLHNLLTGGHTWINSTPRPKRHQVEKRLGVCKDFMPELYQWAMRQIDSAAKKGWLLEE